jgi:hypothetical protein
LPPLRAELAIATPPAGTARRGTIVFGTGGTGDEFYASGAMPTRAAMTELLRAGYAIVDRRWPEGWFGASARGAGLATPSCRYAALIAWIEDEIHTESGGSLCATGNSGGSSEIAYGLTRRGLADRLRAVVLTGGPPMGRIDLGCLDEVADPSWRETCAGYWSDAGQSCPSAEPRCAYADRAMAAAPLVMNVAYDDGTRADRCTGGDASARELFAEDSVVSPGVELSYPDTHVHFIHGRQDCTEAVTLGRFYYEAITSTRTIEFPDATLHTIDRSESGMLAVRQALDAHCVP